MKMLLIPALISTAHSATILTEFEALGHGSVLPTNPYSFPTVTVTVASNGKSDRGLIVNTDEPLAADPDLHVNAGWAIGISEKGEPDDEAKGGTITFKFEAPLDSLAYNMVDVDEGADIIVDGVVISHLTGDQETTGPQLILFSTPQDTVVVRFHGSGVIAGVDPQITSIPEPTALAFSTLALLALLRRRR